MFVFFYGTRLSLPPPRHFAFPAAAADAADAADAFPPPFFNQEEEEDQQHEEDVHVDVGGGGGGGGEDDEDATTSGREEEQQQEDARQVEVGADRRFRIIRTFFKNQQKLNCPPSINYSIFSCSTMQ